MTIPAVPAPGDGRVRKSVDFKLKAGWQFEPTGRTFKSDAGETFSPRAQLPAGSRIVHTAPSLARAEPSRLNEHQRELRRYMQVILPKGESAAPHLRAIRSWPPVEEASAGPELSLPHTS